MTTTPWAKAVNAPECRLKRVKISKYTIKELSRQMCRFLGGAIGQSEYFEEIIVSRLEEDILDMFDVYDVDNGKSLDFNEFVNLCLDIKGMMKEPCLRSDVFLLYEVWMLDLQIKIKMSVRQRACCVR